MVVHGHTRTSRMMEKIQSGRNSPRKGRATRAREEPPVQTGDSIRSTWQSCNDPRHGTTSPDGITMPSASSIIDKTGAVWMLTNGVISRNGAVVGNNYNVSLVLRYGGKIYCRNTSGQFYANAEVASQWLPCTDPRIAVAATAGSFFGINGHFDYPSRPTQLASILKGLGARAIASAAPQTLLS